MRQGASREIVLLMRQRLRRKKELSERRATLVLAGVQ
jgi:hypothetical protein